MTPVLTAEPKWLAELRHEGAARFESTGYPTMKDEDWHFTDVGPIRERTFGEPGEPRAVHPEVLDRHSLGQDWHTVVFVNGRCASESLDLPDGVRVTSLASALTEEPALVEPHLGRLAGAQSGAFTALNLAHATDGAVIVISADAVLARPLHLLFVADAGAENAALYTRNIIVAGRNSQATVIETYASAGAGEYLSNTVTEAFVADGARLDHYKIQTESTTAFHVGTAQVHQGRASRYESFSFATGAALSRTNIYTTLAGDGAEAVLNGLYMVDGSQHVDHQTRIEHVAPNCPSHELYKGILDGRSHGVFNGKVYVHPEAQKTDGKQSNNNLLLSAEAKVDTKPQLEIFADDVKCTHGATVGRLDETALFYMRSRGIGPVEARRLLTYAFAADVLEKIELESLRDALEARVLQRFTT